MNSSVSATGAVAAISLWARMRAADAARPVWVNYLIYIGSFAIAMTVFRIAAERGLGEFWVFASLPATWALTFALGGLIADAIIAKQRDADEGVAAGAPSEGQGPR